MRVLFPSIAVEANLFALYLLYPPLQSITSLPLHQRRDDHLFFFWEEDDAKQDETPQRLSQLGERPLNSDGIGEDFTIYIFTLYSSIETHSNGSIIGIISIFLRQFYIISLSRLHGNEWSESYALGQD